LDPQNVALGIIGPEVARHLSRVQSKLHSFSKFSTSHQQLLRIFAKNNTPYPATINMLSLHYLLPLTLILFYPAYIVICRICIAITLFLTQFLVSLLFRMLGVLFFLAILFIGIIFIISRNAAPSPPAPETTDSEESILIAGKLCTVHAPPPRATLTIVFINPTRKGS
jgi:hypothetical protein